MYLFNFSEKTRDFSNKILVVLFSLIPAALISGNLLTNIFILLIGFIYLLFNFRSELIKNKIFIILSILFLSLVINLLFTQNLELSYPRVLKFFFIIFFILSFSHIINLKNSFEHKIFKAWVFIFLFFVFDILIEYFFGKNILGMKSHMPGRLTGLFGDELVGGYFYFGFVFIIFSYLFLNYKINNLLLFTLFVTIIFISLIIGERANFIKVFVGMSLLVFIVINEDFHKKILSLLLVIFISITFIYINDSYKSRFYNQIKIIFEKDGFNNYLKTSEYGAHYDAAYKIFQNHKYFGVGIKNFRVESSKEIYRNEEYTYTSNRSKTHPHQIHFELISETGLFGYSVFLIFIFSSLFFSLKQYLKTRNIYQLSGIIFILASLIPYLPSGSFYSTFNSTVFWINYALMVGFLQENKI